LRTLEQSALDDGDGVRLVGLGVGDALHVVAEIAQIVHDLLLLGVPERGGALGLGGGLGLGLFERGDIGGERAPWWGWGEGKAGLLSTASWMALAKVRKVALWSAKLRMAMGPRERLMLMDVSLVNLRAPRGASGRETHEGQEARGGGPAGAAISALEEWKVRKTKKR
jgi:hypothetical protein